QRSRICLNLNQKNSSRRFRGADTAIARAITVGDVCVDATKSSSWDTASGDIVANHNIEAMVRAMKQAHKIFYDPGEVLKIPVRARIVREIVDMVFASDQPDTLIRECRSALQQVT
ncbi:hypothetical protein, partial [Novosphingobium beihaiensis]